MEKFEKVEKVVEKCGVSYEEAERVLEACEYDVLEAVITIERESQEEPTADYIPPQEATGSYAEATEPTGTKSTGAWSNFCASVRKHVRAAMDTEFVAERNVERVLVIPVLFVLLGLFLWGATLWLLVIGLFCGFRYRVESNNALASDLNEAMSKAADVAEDVKGTIA